jgi:acetoin utilization protein AcuB
MNIEGCMRHPVVTVKPGDSIRHARRIMEERRINQLPVVSDGRLVGIVTDRDLRDAFPSVFDQPTDGRRRRTLTDPDAIPVDDVMTMNVISLGPDDRVEDAARLMRRERIGALPVLARGRVIGIITRSDILDAFLDVAEPAAAASSV